MIKLPRSRKAKRAKKRNDDKGVNGGLQEKKTGISSA
jgi:hypothetical protein